MAKTLDPFFSVAVKNFAARATAAKTTMTDNTNAVLAFTASAEGSIVNGLTVRGLGTFVSDTVAYAFTSSDAGTTLHLKGAIKLTAATVDATHAPVLGDLGPSYQSPWELSANERLYVGASQALAAGYEFEGSAEDFV